MSPSRMALMTMLCVLMKSVKTLFFDALGLLRIGDASVLGQNESSASEPASESWSAASENWSVGAGEPLRLVVRGAFCLSSGGKGQVSWGGVASQE